MQTIQQFIDAALAKGIPLDINVRGGLIEYVAPVGFMIREVDDDDGEVYIRTVESITRPAEEDSIHEWKICVPHSIAVDPESELNLELLRLERIV